MKFFEYFQLDSVESKVKLVEFLIIIATLTTVFIKSIDKSYIVFIYSSITYYILVQNKNESNLKSGAILALSTLIGTAFSVIMLNFSGSIVITTTENVIKAIIVYTLCSLLISIALNDNEFLNENMVGAVGMALMLSSFVALRAQ